MPLLSVVIPVYNKDKYIAETLESVINQTFVDSEIILINDGSTDNSLVICEEYAKKCDRIKIVSQANSGVSAARNLGISLSSGRYLVLIDADDTIRNDAHELLVNTAINNHCDLVCCGYNFISKGVDQRIYSYPKNVLLGRDYIVNEIVANSIGMKNDGSSLGEHCCLLYSLDIIKNNNIQYDVSQKKEEDKPFILKNLYYAQSMVFLDDCLYNYISRPGSLVSRYSNRFDNLVKNLNLYESLFGDCFDFYDRQKLDYNLKNLEECITFVYVHKKDVESVKIEIVNMLKKAEVLDWFSHYDGNDFYRKKVKVQIMSKNYDRAYSIYKRKFLKYRFKIFVRDLIYRRGK